MKHLIAILILSSILSGCSKQSEVEYYILKGVVIDFDNKLPIVGAKVYLHDWCCRPKGYIDSAISDANGMVSFNCKNEGDYKTISPVRDNYVHPLKYMHNQLLAHTLFF